MSSQIYISIGLLTCFTDVYATLLLGGVLSIRNTLLFKNSKLYWFMTNYLLILTETDEDEEKVEDDDHDDHDYKYYHNNITTLNLI